MQSKKENLSIPRSLGADIRSYGIAVSDLVLYINSKCNLRCKHCYVGNDLLNKNVEVPVEDLISFIRPYSPLDRITIVGGEPLLHPNIEELIGFIGNHAVNEKRLTTNLIDTKKLNVEILINSGFTLCVSIDGHNSSIHDYIRGKNAFARTMSNLQNIISTGIDIEVTHTVNSKNIGFIDDFILMCKTSGIKKLNLHRISAQGNALCNSDLHVTATEWRNLTDHIYELSKHSRDACLSLRYPLLFVTRSEFELLQNTYHSHVDGSYYSQSAGDRIIIYPDKKIYVSSEAFGTDSYIGSIENGEFIFNTSPRNEINLYSGEHESISTSIINSQFNGDDQYPITLSVSFKNNIMV